MAHGYEEIRRVRMEPGPDGKPVPHVYIERRELTEEEAKRALQEQEAVWKEFDRAFAGFDGLFAGMESMFRGAGERMKSFFKRGG